MSAPATWVKLRASEETVEAAVAWNAAQKARYGEGIFKHDGTCGRISELAIKAWAERHAIPVVHNGGYDDKPDLVLNGHAIGAKGRWAAADVGDTMPLVPWKHRNQRWSYWAWCAVPRHELTEVWFMGAISTIWMREIGERWEGPHSPALRCSRERLIGPADFLDLISRPAATTPSREIPFG